MIIGISEKKTGIDFWGQHSYIMLLNEQKPSTDIMLDASGHFYADVHSQDVLRAKAIYPKSISTTSYKNYWKGKKEYLYTFEIELDSKDAQKVRSLINQEDSTRTWLTCTEKSSRVLNKSDLFEGIKETSFPKNLLSQLLNFFETHDTNVKIEKHDLETGEKLETKNKGCTK